MSSSVNGITEKVISGEEILNFIKESYDTNAKMKLEYGKEELTKYEDASGFIEFTYKEVHQSIYVIVGSVKDNNNNNENEVITSEKYTWLSMYSTENNVEIMKTIINHFGGWIDENDCDDIGYYYVLSNPNRDIPPVIEVTMEEIYEKFGGIVKIVKDKSKETSEF